VEPALNRPLLEVVVVVVVLLFIVPSYLYPRSIFFFFFFFFVLSLSQYVFLLKVAFLCRGKKSRISLFITQSALSNNNDDEERNAKRVVFEER
jgi:hypothetical protein